MASAARWVERFRAFVEGGKKLSLGCLRFAVLWGNNPTAPPTRRDCLGCGCSSGVEHNLAKVGVEGSNPFARSRQSQDLRSMQASDLPALFAFWAWKMRGHFQRAPKRRGYLAVTSSKSGCATVRYMVPSWKAGIPKTQPHKSRSLRMQPDRRPSPAPEQFSRTRRRQLVLSVLMITALARPSSYPRSLL